MAPEIIFPVLLLASVLVLLVRSTRSRALGLVSFVVSRRLRSHRMDGGPIQRSSSGRSGR